MPNRVSQFVAEPRSQAVDLLMRMESDAAFVSRLGGAEGDRSPRVTEYLFGVTRQRRWLDFIIASFYKGDITRMELMLKVILRVGVYDLLFMDRTDYAAVNEAVKMAKQKVRTGAGGLVNAILRQVQRQRETLPAPASGSEATDLAIRHSHPDWLVARWLKRLGADSTQGLLEANNRRPTACLRWNKLSISQADFEAKLEEHRISWSRSELTPGFYRVDKLGILLKEGLVRDGFASVQDEAAGAIVTLLGPEPGETVLDLCAAPGGKSTMAAQLMSDEGEVVAVDRSASKLKLVDQSAKSLGLSIIKSVEDDAAHLGSLKGRLFDRVLLDAPCSGTGVLAKRADLRWHRSRQDLDDLVVLQAALLNKAKEMVRPGGTLVYSTCSLEPEENEAHIARFLEMAPEFSVVDSEQYLPEKFCTDQGCYYVDPRLANTDGAFGVRFLKSD